MRKTIGSKKWLLGFFAVLLVLCLIFSLVVYAVDPFFQFRVRDNTYMLNGLYVSPGLIKNYDYDTLIIGSSMTQNFDMDQVREVLGVKPLHIGIGAMTCEEMSEYLALANKVGKAKTVYACIDQFNLALIDPGNKNTEYLMKDDVLSRIQYFFSYEAWFRFMPVDLGFAFLKAAGVQLPESISREISIDKLENFEHNYVFSEEEFLRKYEGEPRDESIDTDGFEERMRAEADKFLNSVDFDSAEYVFFFPPYSGMYWCDAQDFGYFDAFMAAKEYFIERAEEHGATVYDFQAEDLICDLDNYTNSKHYGPEINDWMIECFASGHDMVTARDCADFKAKLAEETDIFRAKYPSLFAAE